MGGSVGKASRELQGVEVGLLRDASPLGVEKNQGRERVGGRGLEDPTAKARS